MVHEGQCYHSLNMHHASLFCSVYSKFAPTVPLMAAELLPPNSQKQARAHLGHTGHWELTAS